MENKQLILSKKCWLSVLTAIILLMLIGSFCDYVISLSLFNINSVFGMILAAYGEYPATLGMIASGVLLYMSITSSRKVLTVINKILCILLIVFGTLMACFMPTIYLTISKPIIYLIGLTASLMTIFFIHKAAAGGNPDEIRKMGISLFIIIFAEMILVNVIKVPWGRARMRLIAVNPDASFMPWWQIGQSMKKTLMAAGVAAEEFKSFPSGHTANAAVLLLLPLLVRIHPQWKNKESIFLIIGFVWTALVAFSRIIMGAHFLTDVTVGFAVTFLVIQCVLHIVYCRKDK